MIAWYTQPPWVAPWARQRGLGVALLLLVVTWVLMTTGSYNQGGGPGLGN